MEKDPSSAGTVSSTSNARRTAFTVLTFLFGAASLGGLFGIGLVIGWFDTDEGGIHRVHDLGFGILYGIVVAGAFFALLRRPEDKPSVFLQVIAAALAVTIAALVSADPGYLTIAVALLVASAILLALHPGRDEVLHPKPRLSPVMSAFVLAGAIPLVWFGLTSARLQRDGSPLDPHVLMGHWTTMASMAFGLVAVGLLASARIRGWRFTAWCAGLGTAVYGLGSIVFHRFPGTDVTYAGSEGIGWGLVALIGGLAFVAVAEWEARRSAHDAIGDVGRER
jgi:hypothetical protein